MFKPSKTIPEFIQNFIRESNAIEGIYRAPTQEELLATERFLDLKKITIDDLEEFVRACQPDAKLRDKKGLDVRVGNHIPPKGGSGILNHLTDFLETINESVEEDIYSSPFLAHQEYETLHPFTDGNGRSGRIIWLWQMFKLNKKFAPLGFLQTYYYQSLSENRNDR